VDDLLRKISSRSARVGVVGLGYVGLPLAVEFSRAGFPTLGFEIDEAKVGSLGAGRSYIPDVAAEDVRTLVDGGALAATTDFDRLSELDAVCICVPTPLRKTKDPDISHIIAATEQIARSLRRGQLVVLESTTYPGTTEEVILPRLSEGGLVAGRDFFLAFSPERVDPGNRSYGLRNTPKVVGGVTPACTERARALYESFVTDVVEVSSASTAEMVKLLENTFRSVNIALVNEIAIMCDKLGVDVWEVIAGAASKPFGFMPFYPGPGLGGHCIPVDPHYLSWKLRTLDYRARFIELASEVNGEMPRYVVHKIADALNERRLPLKGSKVLLLGVAYKRDTSDVRESPALDILELLRRKGADVCFHDPFVDVLESGGRSVRSVDLSDATLARADCVVLVTDHSSFDMARIAGGSAVLVDTRNATGPLGRLDNVIRL